MIASVIHSFNRIQIDQRNMVLNLFCAYIDCFIYSKDLKELFIYEYFWLDYSINIICIRQAKKRFILIDKVYSIIFKIGWKMFV